MKIRITRLLALAIVFPVSFFKVHAQIINVAPGVNKITQGVPDKLPLTVFAMNYR